MLENGRGAGEPSLGRGRRAVEQGRVVSELRPQDLVDAAGRAEHQRQEADRDQHHVPEDHERGHVVPVGGELDEHGRDDAEQRETECADEPDERPDFRYGHGQRHCGDKIKHGRGQNRTIIRRRTTWFMSRTQKAFLYNTHEFGGLRLTRLSADCCVGGTVECRRKSPSSYTKSVRLRIINC